jgi:hypothetical protein
VHVLLNYDDDESFDYQCVLDHFKEAIRKWQRYVPYMARFMEKLLERYTKTLLSSPQLVQITQIYSDSRYYKSDNSFVLRGLNVIQVSYLSKLFTIKHLEKKNETQEEEKSARNEDGVDELIVNELFKVEKDNDSADKILNNESIFLKVDFIIDKI